MCQAASKNGRLFDVKLTGRLAGEGGGGGAGGKEGSANLHFLKHVNLRKVSVKKKKG